MTSYLWLVIVLPLAGAVFLHFVGQRLREPLAGVIATAAIGAAFVVAAVAAVPFFQGGEAAHTVRVVVWEWMPAVGATLELQWDPLSALMTLVVTGVGALIHMFAIGYMHGDERYGRFFTNLNLFAASMLTLVLAGNFAMLFIGWELVGLCSYLLIGFWFTTPSAAAAAKKAFVVNRIGDLGFLIGLMLVFATFGTLSYAGVLEVGPSGLTEGMATAIGLMFLIGAAGKSAQIPLYVWLPDAMAGPTPVSALIHAATMVTAGVYVVARSAPIFAEAPIALGAVALVGALTALWAASIAIAQRDIKRVLAYSTISQLGFMFMAVGATAYVAGVFHLMTHAFFKALLFLGAGSAIHALTGEQDMAKMGGLARRMPVTAITMGIGTLAIAGIPPLSGFWSKDEILGSLFARGGLFAVIWIVGLVAALMTAFYMARLWVLVFWGEPRWEQDAVPHESPRIMTGPLVVLAVLSALAGLLNTPIRYALEHFLEPAFEGIAMQHPPEGWPMFVILASLAVLAGVAGIAAAWFAYNRPPQAWQRFEGGFGRLWSMWDEAYRVDALYGAVVVTPGRRLSELAAFTVDGKGIDAAVDGVAGLFRRLGSALRRLQTGQVRSYGAGFAVGLVAVLIWLVARGLS